ncbi:UvrD-helicase domain-containing protein [Teredinibacter haidensis]|uniref:UvrD-helicase domain-containing protein n=1 Tax=Teredinibacter haidensis TaxID=2731755 RepID=UPI000AA7405B|nr:UvrD-helicase domain-containing protein [Teredinibacter haidensis]
MPNTISKKELMLTEADNRIRECLDQKLSFSVIAGAGSGKTTSLVSSLDYLRETYGKEFRRDGKQIACITFTNRAVDVISGRLGWDDLYLVSTLHSFLWSAIKRFSKEIRISLQEIVIPSLIEKQREKDNGGNSQKALAAREKVHSLAQNIEVLEAIDRFHYDDTSQFSNYAEGKLSHDDVIAISGVMISENEILRKIIGQKYPFIFVDEAQDTFNEIVKALNILCGEDGFPVVGYFGDPMQQIYDKRAGDFHAPVGSSLITKEENFRCSPEVITLLNEFRSDVEQYPAGENTNVKGSVELILVQAEAPGAPRNRYTNDQLDRVAYKFDELLDNWGWKDQENVKLLFLVRQMIARRLGFVEIHKLFTGEYASSRAKEDYESGSHALLKPFIRVLCPLVKSYNEGDIRSVMDILRNHSPTFDPEGENSTKTLKEMLALAETQLSKLANLWLNENLGNILRFARDEELCEFSERLIEEVSRAPMTEDYDKKLHSIEKGRWLADSFFDMDTSEISSYIDFISDNTPFSTQHGVKGEEYSNVVVLFDDIEASWHNYSFTKSLTPATSGEGKEEQVERTRRLAYVCFSRAEVNLKIVFYTPDPNAAKKELVGAGLFSDDQISFFD